MIWIILGGVILFMNGWMTSAYYEREDSFNDSWKIRILMYSFMSIFGFLFLLIAISVNVYEVLIEKIKFYFQLKFWFDYLFTKELENWDEKRITVFYNRLKGTYGNKNSKRKPSYFFIKAVNIIRDKYPNEEAEKWLNENKFFKKN